MESLLERVHSGETLVSDGAMGSVLFALGLESGMCPETVCLQHPDKLEEIARRYAEAGADIVQTNTFGASPLKLSMHGLADECERVNSNAVAAVRNAVGDRVYVCGSCGPCGRLLKPYGDTDPEIVSDGFRRQAMYLADAGVDLFCVETMTDLSEAKLAIEAAKEVAPNLTVLATMTFDPTPRGFFTMMGVDVASAVSGLCQAGADVIGSNCGNGIDKMVQIASAFREQTLMPLIIQSNAGLPRNEGGGLVYDETPQIMASRVGELVSLGVSIIGGCCGTTTEHIQAIRKAVDVGATA